MTNPGFELRAVVVRGGNGHRLGPINLKLAAGGITVLAGASGSGKSTLLRLLNRLDVPTTGSVHWRGRDLAQLQPDEIRAHRRDVGMVFQRPTIAPGTVLENLRLGHASLGTDAALELLARVALSSAFLRRAAGELSGGEQQRVCLARTLVTGPRVVLADEPTASLDPEARDIIEQTVRHLSSVGWIWVTHDAAQAARLADRTVELCNGRLADDSGLL